jgi:hypothetical protein
MLYYPVVFWEWTEVLILVLLGVKCSRERGKRKGWQQWGGFLCGGGDVTSDCN